MNVTMLQMITGGILVLLSIICTQGYPYMLQMKIQVKEPRLYSKSNVVSSNQTLLT
jgi:hypothetical protein